MSATTFVRLTLCNFINYETLTANYLVKQSYLNTGRERLSNYSNGIIDARFNEPPVIPLRNNSNSLIFP